MAEPKPASKAELYGDDPSPRASDNPEYTPEDTGPAFRDIQGLELRKDMSSVQTDDQDYTCYGPSRQPISSPPFKRASIKRNLDDYR